MTSDAETITIIGAIVSDLPIVDKVDIEQISSGDYIRLNATDAIDGVQNDKRKQLRNYYA